MLDAQHELDFLNGPAEAIAPRLLGCLLERRLDGRRLVGKIVEVEAYDQTDAASHSYRGRTPRTDVMFGPAGHLYVYFTYGMHYCMNVVTGPEGYGSAVLIRAIEPLEGKDVMSVNRGGKSGAELTNGPAKICYALKIDRHWNGHDLRKMPLQFIVRPPLPQTSIVRSPRVGITKAVDKPWRFYVAGNPYVSKT